MHPNPKHHAFKRLVGSPTTLSSYYPGKTLCVCDLTGTGISQCW